VIRQLMLKQEYGRAASSERARAAHHIEPRRIDFGIPGCLVRDDERDPTWPVELG